MTHSDLEVILNKAGKFSSISYSRKCKTYKNVEDEIIKESSAHSIRIGASYDALAAVKEARENGELPAENQGLKGFEWVTYPYILKSTKTGKEYLRIELAKNSKFVSRFFENGIEVEKSSILDKLLSSEKSSGEMPTVMNIALESIVSIA